MERQVLRSDDVTEIHAHHMGARALPNHPVYIWADIGAARYVSTAVYALVGPFSTRTSLMRYRQLLR